MESDVMEPVYQEFVEQVKQYLILNTGEPNQIEFIYGAEIVRLPGCNQVVLPNPNKTWVWHSGKDPDGNFIPGSLLISDKTFDDPQTGLRVVSWNAFNAIRQKLGIDAKTGHATGDHYQRGITLVPVKATKAQIEKARKLGRERWEVWQMASAQQTVNEIDAKNEARRRAGMNEIPGGADYVRASMILKHANEKEAAAVAKLMAPESTTVEEISDAELLEFAQRKSQELAAKTAATPEQVEALKAEILNDPEAQEMIKQQFARTKSKR